MANYAADKPGLTEAVATARTPDPAGDTFENDGTTLFFATNSSGTNSYTITFNHADHCSQGFGHDATYALGTSISTAAAVKFIGSIPTRFFNDANGRVSVSYTGTAPATDVRMFAVSTGGVVTGVS